ncbi:alpha/beta hydrolase [Candidatus Odyssella thessalonicensis]|uniref:alpha/beta hydrolase n=1 Tax=Candidatus Odyssella thessalonicensis TaxID=84647 RepID=UPI000225A8B3|nr:dienelactone hydrolase family protein [Candidatus Odyssella thessalonicensis]
MLIGPTLPPKNGGKPKKLVVFLHGYGADGANLIDIGGYWSDLLPDAEFISPNGIEDCEMGIGYQWFGLKDFSPFNIRAGLDRVIPSVVQQLKIWLQERNLTPADLALVGFSQGTMVALDVAFQLSGISAIVGYSGAFYPPIAEQIKPPLPSVCLIHGDMDMVVPYLALIEAQRNLQKCGIQPQTHTLHGLGHSIDMDGLKIGGKFLVESLSRTDSVILA